MIYNNYLKYVNSITSMNKRLKKWKYWLFKMQLTRLDKKSSQTNFTHGKLNEPESTQFLHIGQDFTLKQLYNI